MVKTAVRKVHPNIKLEKGKLLKSSADQEQRSHLKYMAPLKVEEERWGVGRRQMTRAARRACRLTGWLAAAIYGSRDTDGSISVCLCLWKQQRQAHGDILCFIFAVPFTEREKIHIF